MQLEGYVTLSEDCSLRPKRKEQPQSKDPYQLTRPQTPKGILLAVLTRRTAGSAAIVI
jgi:hypothetical protein